MTNKDFAVAVTRFFYYVNNYNLVPITYKTLRGGEVTAYLPEFFKAFEPFSIEHLYGKFQANYEDYGCRGFALPFFAELDGSNRARLCKWINENFKQSEDYGINVGMLEEVA